MFAVNNNSKHMYGNIMKNARKHRKLSVRDIAKAIGVSEIGLYKAETNKSDPALGTFMRMMRACGMSVLIVPNEFVDVQTDKKYLADEQNVDTDDII